MKFHQIFYRKKSLIRFGFLLEKIDNFTIQKSSRVPHKFLSFSKNSLNFSAMQVASFKFQVFEKSVKFQIKKTFLKTQN